MTKADPEKQDGLTRRRFLQGAVCGVGVACISPTKALAKHLQTPRGETFAVLVDLTRCIGCRSCMRACQKINRLPESEDHLGAVRENWNQEDLTFNQWTVVNPQTGLNQTGEKAVRNIKQQCMHCLEPACVSVCPVGALHQTDAGPIIYRSERCIGCRYCMVACPFDIPKFNWTSGLIPVIGKCQFCIRQRLSAGLPPACVEACPTGTLKFGTRRDLLFEAHAHIDGNSQKYIHHVYGESEVGGTSWLYISDIPFESIGFKKDLPQRPLPSLTWDVISKIPLLGAALAGLFGTLAITLKKKGSP